MLLLVPLLELQLLESRPIEAIKSSSSLSVKGNLLRKFSTSKRSGISSLSSSSVDSGISGEN